MNKPLPTQYKKLTDKCINDIMDAANKLYPIITELGDRIIIENDRMVVSILIKKGNNE